MTAGRVIMLAGLAAVLTGCGGGDKPATGTFTDSRDGTVYKTVEIGGKRWFAENLNYDVPNDTLDVCYENSADSCAKYGRLYTWDAAMKACPAGYRLPTDAEWETLVKSAGGSETAGLKLKLASGWNGTNGNGTDDYGFAALPGGLGRNDSRFYDAGNHGHWWTATKNNDEYAAWSREISYDAHEMFKSDYGIWDFCAVRCVED